jgi:type IV secretion system protein VirD4
MNATKILWGQVLLVSATVLAFVWAATEWTAWKLGFQPGLGHPWFEVFGLPVYHPPAFFWWWFAYDAYARDIFVEGASIAAAGGIAAVVVAVTISVWRAREAKRVTTYGSARWAETREVREAGLLGHDGVLLGRWRDEYLRHDGPEHVLCFAPTRSGKGVGLVVPTLLTWPGSAIVHDIKGENWTLTAGWRARFGRVLIFDPTNAQSAAYNPLLEVRRGEWEVRDVQNIADVLVDPEGALEKRNHWEKTSHSLLVGAILHVLYVEPDKTLAGVANFLSDPKRPIETTLRAMMTTPHLREAGVHPVVASAARELLNKSENERSGVLSTAMSFLGLYRDPVVAAVMRQCDWRIRRPR